MRLHRRRVGRLDWSGTRTLADLGDLTARYLEGEADEAPTHCGPPDPETKKIASRLAALNRAGLVTYCSQPGLADEWGRQRAFVDGFCTAETLLSLVRAACHRPEFQLLAHEPGSRPPRRGSPQAEAVVTEGRDGRAYTSVGGWLPPRDVRRFYRQAGCRREAVAVLTACWQVTAYDPEWGRADLLWDTLAAALDTTHQTDTTDTRGPT